MWSLQGYRCTAYIYIYVAGLEGPPQWSRSQKTWGLGSPPTLWVWVGVPSLWGGVPRVYLTLQPHDSLYNHLTHFTTTELTHFTTQYLESLSFLDFLLVFDDFAGVPGSQCGQDQHTHFTTQYPESLSLPCLLISF